MKQTTRESLLLQASALINKQPFTREDSARAERLIQLADSLSAEKNAWRKQLVAEHLAEAAKYNPELARIYRDDLELLPSTQSDFGILLRHGPERIAPERRAQSVGLGTGGGYVVPREIAETLILKMAQFDPLFDQANVNFIMSDTGAPLDVPVGDSTASSTKFAENAQQTPSDIPAFAQVSLGDADTYRSPLQKVSMELVADSHYPLEDVLTTIFAQMNARQIGVDLYGVLATGATQGVVLGTGNSTSVTVDGLYDLAASLDEAYRGPRTVFLMKMATAQTVSKLKDTANMPIFNINPDSNGDRWLLGHKVLICPSAATMAANAKPIILADLSKFVVRAARQVSIKRYGELYATEGAVAFQSFARCNGALAVTAAAKYLQNSAT